MRGVMTSGETVLAPGCNAPNGERAATAPLPEGQDIEAHRPATTSPATPAPRLLPSSKEDAFFSDDPADLAGSSEGDQVEDSFIRRYYMSDEIYTAMGMPEGRNQFLKYFDVDVSTSMVKREMSGPGEYLRFYYCDFLDSKQHRVACQRLKDAWRERQKDTKSLLQWVSDLKPRTKLDAYPMMVFMQDMLKELLEDRLELQLEMLNQAREELDMIQGDQSELQDQCGRMEEDLVTANDSINKLKTQLDEASARERAAQEEIASLQDELKSQKEEVEQHEAEKNRLRKLYEKAQDGLDLEKMRRAVAGGSIRRIEGEYEVRSEKMHRWQEQAKDAIYVLSKKTTGTEYIPHHEMGLKLEEKGADVGQEALYRLVEDIQGCTFQRAMDCDGVGLMDDDVDRILQLAVELSSYVLQTPNVYIAEVLLDKTQANNTGPDDRASSPLMLVPEKKFMFTAPRSGANAFLLGSSLPPTSKTFNHFTGKNCHELLQVNVKDEWNQLHVFDPRATKPRSSKIMYIAAPFFDASGEVRGYIAADTIGVDENTVPDLSAGWRMQYMQRAAHLLGRAMKIAQTGADYETSVSEGPRFFAQRAIASIHGKSEHEVGNNQRKLPDFVEQFPFMKDFATKSSNLFLDYVNDIPHKTFFGVAEGAELNMEILNDMNQLRLHLEDLIFDEAASKRETRFLVARYFHRANDLPPDETIKVWRAALVILGMHNDDVLDPEPKHAWREIAIILNDEKKPVKDKVSAVVRDFNPTDPKQLNSRTTESRFSLAADLVKIIKVSVLVREGLVQMLVLQWIVVCIWTRTFAKAQDTTALELLKIRKGQGPG